jgi:hypothetical protein
MKTEELIDMLATGVIAVDAHVAQRRYALAISVGTVAAVLLLLSLLRVRSDLAEAVLLPMFWVKPVFVASLAAASLLAALRLSRPGASLAWIPGAFAAPVLIVWSMAAISLLGAEPVERVDLFLGQTWKSCPLLIALLSIPLFAAMMWAMRGLAPTRLRLAGFAAGLLAGAAAALVYCLHCPEIEAPFIGFWYLLGMLIPAAAGAALGPSLLRW